MMSIPVQCSQELPVYLRETPQPLTVAARNPAAQRDVDRLPRNMGTFYDLLTEDISKLCVDVPRQGKEDGKMLEQMAAPLLSLDVMRWQGVSSNVSNNPGGADHRCGDRTMHTVGVRCLYWTKLPGSLKSVLRFLPCSSSCVVLCVCVR